MSVGKETIVFTADGAEVSREKPESAQMLAPAPRAGRVGEGFCRIEEMHAGTWVLDHYHKPARVARVHTHRYRGTIISVDVEGVDEVLRVTPDQLMLSQRRVQRTGAWEEHSPMQFARARVLRNAASPPERKLWELLRNEGAGVKFRRQHPIGPFIADFYSRQAGIVVEIDGETHYATSQARASDQDRDRYMDHLGLRILRFTAHDVGSDPEAVIRSIAEACREAVLLDAPEMQWILAKNLRAADCVYATVGGTARRVQRIDQRGTDELMVDMELEDSPAFMGNVCAVHHRANGDPADPG